LGAQLEDRPYFCFGEVLIGSHSHPSDRLFGPSPTLLMAQNSGNFGYRCCRTMKD